MASSLRRSSFDCVCALTIFAVVLVAPLQAAAAEAAGGSARKLLQTTMTSDYTAFCSPPRGEFLDTFSKLTFYEMITWPHMHVPSESFDPTYIIPSVLCNAAPVCWACRRFSLCWLFDSQQ